jgi:hypothetical protein
LNKLSNPSFKIRTSIFGRIDLTAKTGCPPEDLSQVSRADAKSVPDAKFVFVILSEAKNLKIQA